MTFRSWRGSAGDRIVDIACIMGAALVALVAAGEAEATGRVTGGALFWALAIAAAGCVALWWRRRYSVAVALLLAPLVAVTEFVGGAVLVAVFTVAAYRRWSVALGVAGLHVLAAVPYSIVRPDPDLTVVGANLLNVALLALALALGAITNSRRELMASLRERAARAESEARQNADRLRARERESIAREMHDVLAHRISLVSLHAGALEVRPDLSADEVAASAGTIRANAHLALEDLRAILGVLRAGGADNDLRPQPGLADLDALVADCRAAGTQVHVDAGLPDTTAPAATSRTAYRIVQEGLTNARKHAPGAAVRLGLERDAAGELHVRLSNPLVRADGSPVPGAGTGLVGLAERASLAGGRLDHGVRRDADGAVVFCLEAWLPWPD